MADGRAVAVIRFCFHQQCLIIIAEIAALLQKQSIPP
jgi:hypothetical protein